MKTSSKAFSPRMNISTTRKSTKAALPISAVEMEQLEDGLRTMDTQTKQHRALKQDAAQIKTDRALTGALIERLIDRIEVYQVGNRGRIPEGSPWSKKRDGSV